MAKYKTVRQLQNAICESFTLTVTVGATGDVSSAIAKTVARHGRFKATFWGFDDAGNNIVVFKLL